MGREAFQKFAEDNFEPLALISLVGGVLSLLACVFFIHSLLRFRFLQRWYSREVMINICAVEVIQSIIIIESSINTLVKQEPLYEAVHDWSCELQGFLFVFLSQSVLCWSVMIGVGLIVTFFVDSMASERSLYWSYFVCYGIPLVQAIIALKLWGFGPTIIWCMYDDENTAAMFVSHFGPTLFLLICDSAVSIIILTKMKAMCIFQTAKHRFFLQRILFLLSLVLAFIPGLCRHIYCVVHGEPSPILVYLDCFSTSMRGLVFTVAGLSNSRIFKLFKKRRVGGGIEHNYVDFSQAATEVLIDDDDEEDEEEEERVTNIFDEIEAESNRRLKERESTSSSGGEVANQTLQPQPIIIRQAE